MLLKKLGIKKEIHQRDSIGTAKGHSSHLALDYPPMLIPESPLINFLSKLSKAQRRGIKGIRLNEHLGYGYDQVFVDAEALYQWLTPGKRFLSNRAWPAEEYRKQWFRIDLTADHVFQFAGSVENPESMMHIVGHHYF